MSNELTANLDISVIVVCCDNSRTIGKCLKQLSKLAKEIIVLDYGSEDATLRIAETYTDKIYRAPWTELLV